MKDCSQRRVKSKTPSRARMVLNAEDCGIEIDRTMA